MTETISVASKSPPLIPFFAGIFAVVFDITAVVASFRQKEVSLSLYTLQDKTPEKDMRRVIQS